MDPSYLIEKFHTVILGWFMKSVVSIHHQTSMLYNYRHCNYSLIATVHDMRVSVGRGTSLKNVLRHENRRVEEQEKHTLRTTKRCSEWCMSSEQLLGNVSAITTTYERPTLLLSEIPRHIKSVCFFSQISEFKSVPRPMYKYARTYIRADQYLAKWKMDIHHNRCRSQGWLSVLHRSTSIKVVSIKDRYAMHNEFLNVHAGLPQHFCRSYCSRHRAFENYSSAPLGRNCDRKTRLFWYKACRKINRSWLCPI